MEQILPPLHNDAVHSQWDVRPLPFEAKEYFHYLKTDEYRAIKERVFARLGRLCVACGNAPKNLQIHHRDYRRDVLEGADILPLVPMCDDCHEKIHKEATWHETEIRLHELVERQK